jgi:FAD:protein FMN transferase
MVHTATWRALGTTVRLVVHDADPAAARDTVVSVLDRAGATYSRFRSDSELSRLNERPGQVVPISPLLADAVSAALRGARLSDGLVDPTVGRAMRLIGYDTEASASSGAAASPAPNHTCPNGQAPSSSSSSSSSSQ